MSLWTPYADNVALDLTKTTVKEEQDYPRAKYDNSPYQDIQYQPSIVYPQPVNAPVAQLSPVSGGSISSYDSFARSYDQAAYQSSFTSSDLSPPVSPLQGQPSKRPYSTMDVDYLSDDPDFQEFERNALRAMAEKNGGTLLGNNPRMKRSVQSKNESADESYKRQRERNNFAAKQSRDRRKLREIHLALKVTYLRREVASLKAMLSSRVCGRCQ